jgi:putative IMPACT (imprinted ancient) family translation regulator
MPIYGQILFSLTHLCRSFFGGVKLGVGGLISAYKLPQHTLESCEIIEKTIDIQYQVSFDYKT